MTRDQPAAALGGVKDPAQLNRAENVGPDGKIRTGFRVQRDAPNGLWSSHRSAVQN